MAGRGRTTALPAAARPFPAKRRLAGAAAGALGALVVAAGWVGLAPTQLGGSTSYAIIVGNSMEPLLGRGDLAVVRERSEYRAGDVVLYDSAALGGKVLHRIARAEGGRYVLKGDNNDFIDAERPRENMIAGELVFTVPAAGALAEWVRVPQHAALVVGLCAFLALSGGVGIGTLVRRRRNAAPPSARAVPSLPLGDPQRLVLAVAAGLTLSALLAAASFSRPAEGIASLEAQYVQQARLDYSARVPRSPVYPDGMVTTGEPIFPRLVRQISLTVDYGLTAPQLAQAHGSLRLDARLTDGRGWERVFPLAVSQPFDGASATITGSLDLRRIESLIEQVRELTGSPATTYALTVVPQVTLDATSGPNHITETFAPELRFEVAEERLQPVAPDGGGDPFTFRRAAPGERPVAAEISLGPLEVPVTAARRLSLAGLLLSLGLACLIGMAALRRRDDEPSRIASRYGDLVVDVATLGTGWSRTTELADIEGLVRIAAYHGRLILHHLDGDTHTYLVQDGSNAYVYGIGDRALAREPDRPAFDVPVLRRVERQV